MLYRLARSSLTQRDTEKSKDRLGLVRSAISAQAQFLLLRPALSHSALSWGGHHEKVEGHSKNFCSAFSAGICAPSLLKCFRRHWARSVLGMVNFRRLDEEDFLLEMTK